MNRTADGPDDREELLDALEGVLDQACGRGEYGTPDYRLDSGALGYYAEGIRMLAKHGRCRIVEDFGRMVIATCDRTGA